MANQVDTTERLFNLILLLKTSPDWLTLDEIRRDLFPRYPESEAASRQAFERDKRAIREMGIIIDTKTLGGLNAGTTAYRIDPKKNELPDLDLTEDELKLLVLALSALTVDGTLRDGVLSKLGGEDIAEFHTLVSADPQAVSLSQASFSGSMIIDLHAPLGTLPVVTEAAAKRMVLEFGYQGKQRSVHPYGVLARGGHWYLIANDPSKNELRRFRLDRMVDPVPSGGAGAFERPEGLILRDHMPADPKVINDDPESKDDFAIVFVDESLANGVERELGSNAVVERIPADAKRGTAAGVKFRVPCANRWAFRSWMLGLVDRGEVVEPAEVRDELVNWLRKGK